MSATNPENLQAGNSLVALSDAMAEAVERAAAFTVMVNARRRLPASGILYSPGLILTADHVVEREDDIQVYLATGDEGRAAVAGRDPGSDLALLRLESAGGTAAEATPQDPRVGQLALALGRPGKNGIQASLGVVSALGGPLRTGRGGLIDRYLATDAIPYPGFSGGPLIDASGRVLGINTSGLARGSSLAIPSDLAWSVAASLAEHGHIRRGYLGLRTQPVRLPTGVAEQEPSTGLLIVGIEEDSPAEKGGLMVGDILTRLAGKPISDHDDLLSQLSTALVGQATQVAVLRGGQPLEMSVIVGERK
jgi:S1-C subfamily serine protease